MDACSAWNCREIVMAFIIISFYPSNANQKIIGLESEPQLELNKARRIPLLGEAPEVQALDVGVPRPRIYGGGPEIIKSPKSPALDRIIKSLAARAERIAGRKVSPDKDNMLLITTEGRKAALDPRLVDPSAPADPEGKISHIVRNLLRYYHESQDTLGVQAVFIDTNCPRNEAA